MGMCNIVCVVCGKSFSVKEHRLPTAKFCSYKCSGISKKGKVSPLKGKSGHKQKPETIAKIILALTGRPVSDDTRKKISKSNTGKKLSEEAKNKIRLARKGKSAYWNKGDKSSAWKGGVTSLNISIRKTYKYNEWREGIFTRDNFTCTACGNIGGRLNADHITPYSIILYRNKIKTIDDALNCAELWDINNGRTLCESCHRKTDSFGGASKITNKLVAGDVYAL